MLRALWNKIKESAMSVIPLTLIVLLLGFTPLVSFTLQESVAFLIAAAALILGMALFSLGADMAMTPMGEQVGSGLSKSQNLWLLLFACLLLGAFVTIAEPDVSVLAAQISGMIDNRVLIFAVGGGVGIFLVLAVLRIVVKIRLSMVLLYFYLVLFALAALVVINGGADFLTVAFDAGGVTTGPITVPFIMALGVGVAVTLGGKNADENSFGLVALCSIGPILAVLILGLAAKGTPVYTPADYSLESHLGTEFGKTILRVAREVGISLGMIVLFFLILQIVFLRLPRRKLYQMAIGIGYTFAGLVIFLSAATIGFMPIGYQIGAQLAANNSKLLPIFGFLLGLVVVFAEPAIHVLNRQVEGITNGGVGKRSMLVALSIGVGISIGLSMLRILLGFNILYYLVPGFLISLGLSFFVPRLYTAIAFDSGGVASGPLTSTFILPFAIGAGVALNGVENVMSDAFGIVAMVAMTPLITIQVLGFRAIIAKRMREKRAMKKILAADDEQIINFM
ncbi:MAG: DUF1538 domain-containing protein [Ruminococcaceae bacterium]|nr:DUF1538 domain-containing protein [Oscillospiraceae bacterium]